MRTKSLLATTALAVLFAASAQAAVTGSLDANLTYGAEAHGMKSHFYIGNFAGQLEFGVMDGWDSQVEIFGAGSGANKSSWYGRFNDQLGLSTYGATAHFNTRWDDFRFGPFLMIEETTVGDRGYNSEGAGGNLYLATGGEAQWFLMPDLDVTAQVGGLFHLDAPGNFSANCGSLCNAFFATVSPTWFFDDNLALSANFGIVTGQGGRFTTFPNRDKGEIGYDYGARVEYQFEDSPFSTYLAWDANSFHWDPFGPGSRRSQDDNTVSIGVKFYFNGNSLRRQHEEAGFKTPHFERMINQSLSPDDVDF